MAKYKVVFEALTTFTIAVEAKTLDEAVELAADSGTPSLCHQCSGGALSRGLPWYREEGDAWEEVMITTMGGDALRVGPSLLDYRAATELTQLAETFDTTYPEAAQVLRDRAIALKSTDLP